MLVERGKFASTRDGVSWKGKGRRHIVEEMYKSNTNYYINDLLPNLVNIDMICLEIIFVFQKTTRRLTWTE